MGMRVRGKATARPEKVGDPTLDFQAEGTGRRPKPAPRSLLMHEACQSAGSVFPEFPRFPGRRWCSISQRAPHFASVRYDSAMQVPPAASPALFEEPSP